MRSGAACCRQPQWREGRRPFGSRAAGEALPGSQVARPSNSMMRGAELSESPLKGKWPGWALFWHFYHLYYDVNFQDWWFNAILLLVKETYITGNGIGACYR